MRMGATRKWEAAAVGAVAFAFFYFLLPYSSIAVHQARDLLRAEQWAQLNPIFHGPEISGVGFAPGPFYYWLLLPLIWIGPSADHILIYAGLLLAFASSGLYSLTLPQGRCRALLFTLFFISSASVKTLFLFNQPATFSVPFVALAFVFGGRAFGESRFRDRDFYLALVLSTAGLQIHPVALTALAALITFASLAAIRNWPRPSRRAVWIGGLSVIASILFFEFLNWISTSGASSFFFFESLVRRTHDLVETAEPTRLSAPLLLVRIGSSIGFLLSAALILFELARYRGTCDAHLNSEEGRRLCFWMVCAGVGGTLAFLVVSEPRHFRFLFPVEFTVGLALYTFSLFRSARGDRRYGF